MTQMHLQEADRILGHIIDDLQLQVKMTQERIKTLEKRRRELRPQPLDLLCAEPCDDWDCKECEDIRK